MADINEYQERSHLLQTLRLLAGRSRTLRLSVMGEDRSIRIDKLDIAGGSKRPILMLDAPEQLWRTLGVRRNALVLEATNQTNTLIFDGFDPVRRGGVSDKRRRCFSLPSRMRVENRRREVRLAFLKGMRPYFEIAWPGGRHPLTGRVLNLSAGGCQLEMATAAAMTLAPDGAPINLSLIFPSGATLRASVSVRYANLAANEGLARVGLAFVDSDRTQHHRIDSWLRETEIEIAARKGRKRAWYQPSELFKAKPIPSSERHDYAWLPAYYTPMNADLKRIADTLCTTVLAMRRGADLPGQPLVAGARQFCRLHAQDRQTFLFSLCLQNRQPPMIQHVMTVAGRLLDMLSASGCSGFEPAHVVLGVWLHILPGLSHVRHPAATLLDARSTSSVDSVRRLLDVVSAHDDLNSPVVTRLIEGLALADTGIDPDDEQGHVIAAARVVTMVDAHVRGWFQDAPDTFVGAVRRLAAQPDRYDEYWLRRLLRCQGQYPIGTIVSYGNGFRAQVAAQDDQGMPDRVRVLRLIDAPDDQRINIVIDGVDLRQLGPFEDALPHEWRELYQPLL